MGREVIESTSQSLLLPLISTFSPGIHPYQRCVGGGRTFKDTHLAILVWFKYL